MSRRSPDRKFTDEQIVKIRQEFEDGVWPTQLDAANHYDVSQSRISAILTRKTYKDVP
jgi:hypothetical protein